jgi:hypothetical protein
MITVSGLLILQLTCFLLMVIQRLPTLGINVHDLNVVPGYPKFQCERVSCPDPYMGPDQPGAPPDPSLPAQDPFGTGKSYH